MPSENLAQSMSPLFPLNPVLIALHLTAYLFMAKSRTELQCLSRRKKIPRGRWPEASKQAQTIVPFNLHVESCESNSQLSHGLGKPLGSGAFSSCAFRERWPASVFPWHSGLQTQLGPDRLCFSCILWVMWAEDFPTHGIGMKYAASFAGRVTQSNPLPYTAMHQRDRCTPGQAQPWPWDVLALADGVVSSAPWQPKSVSHQAGRCGLRI